MLDASPSPPLVIVPTSRRTRKRFTNVQLTMLENLFHQNSHPSREDREALAKAAGMEIKSVTIWFQNKRQTERKSAASNNGQAHSFNEHNVHPNITSAIHTFSLHSTESPPSASPVSTRPSLDRVASRSELRTPSSHTHHTHTQARPHSPRRLSSFPPSHPPSMNHQRQLYDHLPSSPPFPTSPPTSLARDFIEFGKSSANAKTRRTLEWACEAARIADRDKDRERDKDRDVHRDRDAREGSYCTSVNPGYHRHHVNAHQHSHHNLAYGSAEAISTSRTSTYASSSASSRSRSAAHRERSHQQQQHGRHTHRKDARDGTRESTRDRLARPSSSLTLRGRSEGSGSFSSVSSSTREYTPRGSQEDEAVVTESEEEEEEHHEAITPPTPSITNRWTARLTKTSTNTSLASSSSSTPSTSASISREGSTTSTNTSITSLNNAQVEDDAMFKAALALCGLGRIGQVQNQNSTSHPTQRGI